MPSLFQMLGPVLTRNIDFIAQSEGIQVAEVYARIVAEADRNSAEWYSNNVPNLNYHQPDCRLAYLYIVAAANAATFKHVITTDLDLKAYFIELATHKRAIKICAFGAGPGTELLGMAQFFAEAGLGHSVEVDFQLIDRVQEWTDTWYGIRDEVRTAFENQHGPNRANWPMIPSGNFVKCDVTQLEPLANLSNIWCQDVYVLNFLLSEIFDDDPRLNQFLSFVAERAPKGSRFVFIERKGGRWENRMANIARQANLRLSGFVNSAVNGLRGESPEDLGDVYKQLNLQKVPRLNWNVVYSVGVKE
jgi:hypothetical protein